MSRIGARVFGLFLTLGVVLSGPAFAVKPDEMLADPALEQRARSLGQELRCLVCQNQSIDDSDADLARDLRILLRQRLLAGDSDAQAKQFLVDRYGNYVLLKPPFTVETFLLWCGPLLLLLLAVTSGVVYLRSQSASPAGPAPLTAEEEQRLAAMLQGPRKP